MTALRIEAGMVSEYPMSSGRLGAAQPGTELPAPQERRQPARTRQQVHGLADDGLLEGLPRLCGVPVGRGLRLATVPAHAVVAEPVQLDAQPDQVIQGGRVSAYSLCCRMAYDLM